MKLTRHLIAHRNADCRAFTLAELMVSMAILLIMITSIISGHLYGLRMFEFIKPKLNASDEARKIISTLLDEVRTASTVRVGTGSLTGFIEASINTRQQGNALQIMPTTNLSAFIVYYWDAADQKLKRTTNGSTTAFIVASSITNRLIFSSEDFSGTILTNNQNNRVVGVDLQFCQLQYPGTTIGPGKLYDYYQVRTRITKR